MTWAVLSDSWRFALSCRLRRSYPVPDNIRFRWAIELYSKTRLKRSIIFTISDLLGELAYSGRGRGSILPSDLRLLRFGSAWLSRVSPSARSVVRGHRGALPGLQPAHLRGAHLLLHTAPALLPAEGPRQGQAPVTAPRPGCYIFCLRVGAGALSRLLPISQALCRADGRVWELAYPLAFALVPSKRPLRPLGKQIK